MPVLNLRLTQRVAWILLCLPLAPATAQDTPRPQEQQPQEKPGDEPEPAGDGEPVVVERAAAVDLKAAAVMDAQVNDDANMEAVAQQFTRQLRPMLTSELHFVRMICKPTREEYDRLKADSSELLTQVVKQFVDVQKKMNRGVFAGGPLNGFPDPSQEISVRLADLVKTRLSAEQLARYQTELDKRAARRQRIVIDNLVSRLDKDLVLSTDQREQLREVLDANWKAAWGHQLQLYISDYNQLPDLPSEPIELILTASQREVWSRIPRNLSVFFGFDGGNGVEVIEVEEPEAGQEAPAPTPASEPRDPGQRPAPADTPGKDL